MPLQPYMPVPGIGRNERVPVAGVDVAHAEQDEQHDHRDLDGDDDRIERGRLLDADVADGGDRRDDRHGGQIDDGAGAHQVQRVRALIEWRVRKRGRDVDVHLLQEADRVARPADRDGGDRKQVLQDQVPADEPGDALAERRVRVGVGAAGDRDHRGEFRVAQSGERAAEAGDDERQRQRRSGVLGGGGTGEHEDAGADDAADAEQRQLRGGERASQLVAGGFLLVQLGNGLGRKKLACHGTPVFFREGLYTSDPAKASEAPAAPVLRRRHFTRRAGRPARAARASPAAPHTPWACPRRCALPGGIRRR